MSRSSIKSGVYEKELGEKKGAGDETNRESLDVEDLEADIHGKDIECQKENGVDGAGGFGRILSRVVTARSNLSTDPEPTPDGGWHAWTQVIMAHLVIFNTWGYIQSYGVFQSYYTTALNRPPSDIAWVGGVQVFLLFFIGTASGRAMDAGIFKPVFIAGVVIQILGVFMASLSTKYWQLFLAQGVCVGIGNGLQFCPTASLVATYFNKNRALALGVSACGSATGGLVFPALVRSLLPIIGFPWTLRVVGFVMMAIGILTSITLKTRLPPRKSGPLVEWGALKELPYLLYCLAMFLNFWSLYFAFYYISSYARSEIGLSYTNSINLLLIMNGVGIPMRLIPSYLSDRFTGPLNIMIPFNLATAFVIYAWIGVRTSTPLYVFAVIYGCLAAGAQAMFPAVLSSLTEDPKKMGTRMGMGFSIVSFACLTGPPLGGALIQKGEGRYLYAQLWAGSAMIVGTLTLMAARVAKLGWTWKGRI